jgi:hypothetical protein
MSVTIEQLNIRLPGWQGDPSQLARQIAGQLQNQAADLVNAQQLNINLRGHFAGQAGRVARQIDARAMFLSTQQNKRGVS